MHRASLQPTHSADSLSGLHERRIDQFTSEFLGQRPYLPQRHRQMALDRRGNILWRLQTVLSLGTGILQPGNIETVSACGDFRPGEPPETPGLAFVLPLRPPQRIVAERPYEPVEIPGLQRI